MTPLTSVGEALAQVLASADRPVKAKDVAVGHANRRTLARDVVAQRTQPPFAASAMDGYAVRAADLEAGATLKVIGVSSAGHRFKGRLGAREAVRIFTGAPLPDGADSIVIQENAKAPDGLVTIAGGAVLGRHIRRAGVDFHRGEVLLSAGMRLDPQRLALAAAGGHAELAVRRKPLVAVLATGDELVRPGQRPKADQIVASNSYAVMALVEEAGGKTRDLGIASDDLPALKAAIAEAKDEVDVLVTVGGASVGDHDLVQQALVEEGMSLAFWRIAMRPGKPLMHGRLGRMIVLGLPGNPVSAIVCAILFVVPLVRALQGDPDAGRDQTVPAKLAVALPANDERQDYLRATLKPGEDGLSLASPLQHQDSSLLGVLAQADALIVRPPRAPAAAAGDLCRIIRLRDLRG